MVSDLDKVDLVERTELFANYPNPFNPSTTISFAIFAEGPVSIVIYNIRGQKVRTLVDDVLAMNQYRVVWNGADDHGRQVSSGVYFYQLKANDQTFVRRMILMKQSLNSSPSP